VDNSDKRCDDGGDGSNSGEMILNKKGSTSCPCEQNNIAITEGIDTIVLDNKSTCANCGKEGDDINNICNKCKQVKYCNAACKKKHRHKHKKDCEEHQRLAAELHDEELFKQPPQLEDCPICFLRIPTLNTGSTYMSCCGKVVCSGCCYAPLYDNQGNEVDNQKCSFCRTPFFTSDEEAKERNMARVKAGDPIAIYSVGCGYANGTYGLPQDYTKALEYYHRAGELGDAVAYNNIGLAYMLGEGVEVDKKKAYHYYKLSAMAGNATARRNLGHVEGREGKNQDRALKHYMIAVRGGDSESLKGINMMYSAGYATKEDYTKALQSYQAYLEEVKSPQRDKAAAAHEDCRYY